LDFPFFHQATCRCKQLLVPAPLEQLPQSQALREQLELLAQRQELLGLMFWSTLQEQLARLGQLLQLE
jgi:hypothetical protein